MNAPTLFQALEAIPDRRTKKGRRFPLPTILIIALAAMLSGANDLLAIARWGRRLSPKALQAIGASTKRKQAPCHATYHYVFQELSPEALQQALGVLVAVESGLGHVAIDGKRLRHGEAMLRMDAVSTRRLPACTCCTPSRPNCGPPSVR